MKSTLIDLKPKKKELPYPKLVEINTTNEHFIVLMFSINGDGVVVHTIRNGPKTIGKPSLFRPEVFHDFEGTINLSN